MDKKKIIVLSLVIVTIFLIGFALYQTDRRIEEDRKRVEEGIKKDKEYMESINDVANKSAIEIVTGKKYITFEEAREISGSNDVKVILQTMKEYNDKIDKGE